MLVNVAAAILIREVENEIAKRYAEQKMRCPTHLCIGQASPPVAISQHLLPKTLYFQLTEATVIIWLKAAICQK